MFNISGEEEYIACSNCGEIVPRNCKFCPIVVGSGIGVNVISPQYNILIYLLTLSQNPIAILMLIVTHFTGAYLIIHE